MRNNFFENGNYFKNGKVLPLAIFIFFLALYVLTSSAQLIHVDEVTKYLVTKSIVERGSLDVDIKFDTILHSGKYYSVFGPAIPFLGIPFYITGRFLDKFITGVPGGGMSKVVYSMMAPLYTALTCLIFFLFSIAFGYSRKTSIWLTLVYGLTTMVWYYSRLLYTDGLPALFLLWTVYMQIGRAHV